MGPPILLSALVWQSLVSFLRAKKLPHELFVFTHHVTLTLLSFYYIGRAAFVLPHPELASSNNSLGDQHDGVTSAMPPAAHTDWWVPLHGAPGDHPGATIPYVFLGYLAADMLNRHLLRRPFKALDWFHHVIATVYTTVCTIMLPATSLDAALIGSQELSSVFLTLTDLGYAHERSVKALFIAAFILLRVVLGGMVAIHRTRQCLAGAVPFLVAMFWCVQLMLNCVFTWIILKKVARVLKSGAGGSKDE